MSPCPVCGNHVDAKSGKLLPTSKKTLQDYCRSMGIPNTSFQDIETRRYVCYSHFGKNQFYIVDGQKKLNNGALPKKLTDEESYKMKHLNMSRIRLPKFIPPKNTIRFLDPVENSHPSNEHSDFDWPDQATVSDPTVTSENVATAEPAANSEPGTSSEVINTVSESINNNNADDEEPVTKDKFKYVMVQLDKLLELLQRCSKCGHKPKNAQPSLNFIGTACTSTLWCKNCKNYDKWESQNRLPNSQRYDGNVDLAIAATLVPVSYPTLKQLAELVDMPMIGKTTFYRVTPTVWKQVEDAYNEMQNYVINRLLQQDKVNVGADGQFDSRGYSAYLCSTTFMDVISGLIVDTVCLDKRVEKCPSTELEKKGVEIGLKQLLQKDLKIASLTTDRSKSVISLMKTSFSSIIHYYDFWHIIKGKAHQLRLECKNVRGVHLKQWSQALLNHLWWAVRGAGEDKNKCLQFVSSALLHVIDIHKWPAGPVLSVLHNKQASVLKVHWKKTFPNDPLELEGDIIGGMKFVEHLECGHDEPSTKVALDPSSKSFGVLQKSFTSDSFLHDVQNCSPHFATSLNESFHSLKTNKYCTKNYYYGLKGFTNRTQLAALHHNHNILDTESGKRKKIGKKEYAYRAKHRDGEFVTKQRKTPPDFSWKKTILQKSRINIPTIHHKKTQGEIEGDITDISENEDEDNPPSRDEYFGRMILNEMGLEEEDIDDNE